MKITKDAEIPEAERLSDATLVECAKTIAALMPGCGFALCVHALPDDRPRMINNYAEMSDAMALMTCVLESYAEMETLRQYTVMVPPGPLQ